MKKTAIIAAMQKSCGSLQVYAGEVRLCKIQQTYVTHEPRISKPYIWNFTAAFDPKSNYKGDPKPTTTRHTS